jgi:hypothetical protein
MKAKKFAGVLLYEATMGRMRRGELRYGDLELARVTKGKLVGKTDRATDIAVAPAERPSQNRSAQATLMLPLHCTRVITLNLKNCSRSSAAVMAKSKDLPSRERGGKESS